jgi:hypothetical protein
VLSASEIRAFLKHDDQMVRDQAANRLIDDARPHPVTACDALEAFDLHAGEGNGQLWNAIGELPVTSCCARVLAARLVDMQSRDMSETLERALQSMSVEALREAGGELVANETLRADLRAEISHQAAQLERPPEQLWQELMKRADLEDEEWNGGWLDADDPDDAEEGDADADADADEDEDKDEDEDEAESDGDDEQAYEPSSRGVLLALAQHREFAALRVMEVLNDPEAEGGREEYAVELAGMLRLDEAVGPLMERLGIEGADLLRERIEKALPRIATNKVVERLEADYAQASEDVRFSMALILSNIFTSESEAATLRLMPHEQDEARRTILASGLCKMVSAAGLELVEPMVAKKAFDPMWASLDEEFYGASLMLGRPSELLEKIKARTEAERESFRRQRSLTRLAEGMMALDLPDEDPFAPQEPFRREEEKTGRNDPCPCGSGKKYKKCCGK